MPGRSLDDRQWTRKKAASNTREQDKKHCQTSALACTTATPLHPSPRYDHMKECVDGERWLYASRLGSPSQQTNKPSPSHSHCFIHTHALAAPPPQTTQHTTMSVVAKIWDGLRTSYTRLVVGELNNHGTSCCLACRLGCMPSASGLPPSPPSRHRRGCPFEHALSQPRLPASRCTCV